MILDADPSTERTLSIDADLSRLSEIRGFAEQMAADVGFDNALQQQIKLAVNEAAANAIEHGSPSPDDEVEVRAAVEGQTLAIYVVDGGTFIRGASPRGSLPERGRGLAFMELLMDDCQVQPGAGGTVVRLAKRLPE